MSQMRYDWLADRWVIFAPSRADRPNEYEPKEPIPSDSPLTIGGDLRKAECPFCRGNESHTPVATLSLPQGAADWQVRVVDNRFPAVVKSECTPIDFRPLSSQRKPSRQVLYHQRPLVGGHEVIIECPEHQGSFTNLPDRQVELIFEAYQSRVRYWLSHERIQYVVLFKNVGPKAGASLSHAHSQLIAMDFLPSEVAARQKRLQAYESEHMGCPLCATVEEELADASRIVLESSHFLAYCPYASPTPFVVYLVPKAHGHSFEQLKEVERNELALTTRNVLHALEKSQPDFQYNLVLHTHRSSPDGSVMHWHMEIIPRLTTPAGFEWGSDCFINPCYPEEAASILRQHIQA